MSNILKPIDLADRAIRRAVFAVFDAAEHRANRKGSGMLSLAAAIAALVGYYSIQFYRFAVEPARAHTTERTR